MRSVLGTSGERVCDIGAGEGVFVDLLRQSGDGVKVFEVGYTSRYIDSDALCMIGLKSEKAEKFTAAHDDYREVIDVFNCWDRDTQTHFANS